MNRRAFLSRSILSVTALVAAKLAAFHPLDALAKWNGEAFGNNTMDGVLQALYGKSETRPARGVKLKAPDIAENGRVVPVVVDATKRTDIRSMALIVDNNPNPLAFTYRFDGVDAYVKTRIKMGETSRVLAVLETNSGKLEVASKEVRVTIGGCGG